MTEAVDYAVFYEQLSELVSRRETGTIYVKNDANHLAIIGIRGGKIISLACGPKRGRSAVELIRHTRSCSVRVDDGAVSFHEHELPSTAELLEQLSPLQDLGETASQRGPGSSLPDGVAGHAQILCNLLTEFIGPVAPLVCEEKIVSADGLAAPEQLAQVIHELALEIDDPEEARQFVNRAEQALQTSGRAPQPSQGSAEPVASTPMDVGALKEGLCDLLTDYLGPVAPLVCEENISALGKSPTQQELEQAIKRIAGEIGDEAEASEFIAAARKQFAAVP
jgi:hypothetical protein